MGCTIKWLLVRQAYTHYNYIVIVKAENVTDRELGTYKFWIKISWGKTWLHVRLNTFFFKTGIRSIILHNSQKISAASVYVCLNDCWRRELNRVGSRVHLAHGNHDSLQCAATSWSPGNFLWVGVKEQLGGQVCRMNQDAHMLSWGKAKAEVKPKQKSHHTPRFFL